MFDRRKRATIEILKASHELNAISCHCLLLDFLPQFLVLKSKYHSVISLYLDNQLTNGKRLGGLLSTQEARVARGYRLVRLLRFFRA